MAPLFQPFVQTDRQLVSTETDNMKLADFNLYSNLCCSAPRQGIDEGRPWYQCLVELQIAAATVYVTVIPTQQ